MKLKAIIVGTVTALSLSFAMTSFAGYKGDNSYYPPERINCSLESNKLSCEGFNHSYLVEDTYTADLTNKDQVFSFTSGAAYFTQDKSESTVFFTYRNSHFKTVKIKSVTTNIRPDFENGSWTKVHDDLYVCKAGYMHCPITSLPSKRS